MPGRRNVPQILLWARTPTDLLLRYRSCVTAGTKSARSKLTNTITRFSEKLVNFTSFAPWRKGWSFPIAKIEKEATREHDDKPFSPSKPKLWTGRYARIPGDTSVFHLRYFSGQLRVAINWNTDDGNANCPAVSCDTATSLAEAVEKGKRAAGGGGGGSFMINEYGQVLVPASDGGGKRYYVGQLKGRLLFENPFDEEDPIDLADCSHLQPGDPWKQPYVGFPYNLSNQHKIYHYRITEDGGMSVFHRNRIRNLSNPFVVFDEQERFGSS